MDIKYNKKKILLFIFIFLLICFSCYILSPIEVFADVGNNNRYDEGFSGDGDGLFILIYIILWLLENFGPVGLVPALIIIIFIISIIYNNSKGSTKNISRRNLSYNNDYPNDYFRATINNEKELVMQIQEYDKNFSSDEFKQYASECFVKLHKAWTARDWEPIRHFETDTLFNMHNSQLQEYVMNGTINVIERINVQSTKIIDYHIQGDKEIINVHLVAIMRDYIIDENTKNVVEGNKYKDVYNNYRLEFIRTLGVKTENSNKLSTTNCPNCGAPTTVTSSGQCSYCGSVITSGNYSWVLNELTTF